IPHVLDEIGLNVPCVNVDVAIGAADGSFSFTRSGFIDCSNKYEAKSNNTPHKASCMICLPSLFATIFSDLIMIIIAPYTIIPTATIPDIPTANGYKRTIYVCMSSIGVQGPRNDNGPVFAIQGGSKTKCNLVGSFAPTSSGKKNVPKIIKKKNRV
ncbi:MAG: hypothetical protein WC269_05700, partial [Candidatus Gracilibacteria bacterium]